MLNKTTRFSLGLALLVAAAPPAPAAQPVATPAFFESHREKVMAKLPPGSIAVFHSASETALDARADAFRQDSDFWYLTGVEEPGAVAVLVPSAARDARYVLFVQPKDFAAEQWTGWRLGVEGAKAAGAGQAYPLSELGTRLGAMAADKTALYYEAGGDRDFQAKLLENWNSANANVAAPRPAADASPLLGSLRLVKDPLEIELLREASRLSAQAHVAALAEVAPGRHEYDLKAAMVGVCLARGAARMSYPPIVASGRNSVILHHERDDKELKDGEIIVNDTACEYSMYASDVTRSYPVSGRFSPEQKQVYEIVLAAQKAGFAATKPGVPFHEVHDATVGVIVDGLMRLGILTGDRGEIIKTRAYQKFYPHGSSHWVGLNVHDAGSYSNPPGVARLERYGLSMTKLEPGMVITVEPGIYIAEKSTADPKWWNIGVRIEDVVLVTPAGMECLSCAAPRELADVEKALAAGRAQRGRRAS